MRLHDSPKDKQSRDEAVQLILRRVGATLGLFLVGGLLAYALGVPLLVIVIFGIVTIGLVLFTT
jgi:ABC-type dipeptide/oligopeptide/nickel transport system permease component